MFIFRGRRGDLIKIILLSGIAAQYPVGQRVGRLGRVSVQQAPGEGPVRVVVGEGGQDRPDAGASQAMLLEAIGWRLPRRSWTPLKVG